MTIGWRIAWRLVQPADEPMKWIIPICVLYAYGGRASTEPPSSIETHPVSVEDLRRSALQHSKEGQFEAALNCYREIIRRADASEKPDQTLPDDLHNIASISSALGRYQDAERFYRRAADILERRGETVDAGLTYTSLAEVLQIEGSFANAEASYSKAVVLLNQYAGSGDLRTAKALNAMGWLYTLWGKVDKAKQILQKALTAATRALPEDSPKLILFLDVQASFLTTTGKYSEAEKLWRKALQIGKKAYPGDGFEYEEVFLHLGQAYATVGDERSAEEMFRSFLAIQKPVGTPSVTEAVVRAELGKTYTNLQNFKQAEPLLLESVRMIEGIPGKVPLAHALILSYFGDYNMARAQWTDAEVQYRKALKMREDMLGESAPDVAASMLSLSKALRKLHRKQEAEQLLERASCIMVLQKNPVYTGGTIDVRALGQK